MTTPDTNRKINKSTESKTITPTAITRIKNDIATTKKEILEGIHVVCDETDITQFHAIIEGPSDTPYSGGIFYFHIKMPYDYPWSPPTVLLKTTGRGRVRFNPNLYNSGKVCLSILGTWEGPGWVPTYNIHTVLLSIQSLMNKEPYFNEPGYDGLKNKPSTKKISEEYSERVEYEKLRVAVLGMVSDEFGDAASLPASLKEQIGYMFIYHYDEHMETIRAKIAAGSKFGYADLAKKFEKKKLAMNG